MIEKGTVRCLFYWLSRATGWRLAPYPAYKLLAQESSKDFALGQGGKRMNPQERSKLRDRGEYAQPTPP
ncbi:hypothetical protein EAJ18_18040 [Citrobacter amalonaticus]|uniref:Uncharacterized protein n=1 Tax=Citrobacter amalonaticus TaxID=35703 RepID=A0ABY0HTM9_CITAM|nr:hypothetical protein AL524_24440 [Citrobacter amalonaticus]MBY5253729.1 hypothetical protein [Citrobacter amalonaticus]QDK87844.1 hypothetical protein FEO47_21235 [Citrobacter amalonaticus]RSC57387.1 hypothetical protein EGW07_06935 [Citrobacter amalonaticus]RYT41876.1 hypothetical protein EAJ18_18040 [Citrobacter amalonaticus]